MNEEEKIVEVEEAVEVETEEVKKEGALAKVSKFMKRNGKRIAIGVAVVVGLGLAYGLGKSSSGEDSDEEIEDEIEDEDFIELEETEFTETDSE